MDTSASWVPVDQDRVERWLTFVRTIGVAFAVPAVATTPHWPNDTLTTCAWVVTAFFAVGTLAVWWFNGRIRTPDQRRRFSAGAIVFDSAVITGYVLTFAYEEPYVTWSLVVALPIAGALRYGARGSVVMAAYGIVLFAAQSLVRQRFVEEPMLSAQIYASGLVALIAGAMTVLVRSLERQNAAYRAQAVELAQAHRVRDRLLAVTSHEFRGSLAAIASSAATMRRQRQRLPQEQSDLLLLGIEGQIVQLLRLVEDLLVTAEAGSGELKLNPSWRPVQPLVDRALDAAALHRDGHAVEVFVEPLECHLDHDRIAQVLRNLVENAYKYSDAHLPVVVSLECAEPGVLITVGDHGPGIPSEVRRQLFEPFRRGAHNGAPGSGLGLYVVHRIVMAAGGSIDVWSSAQGTTFSVRLPCETRPLGGTFGHEEPMRDN
jgi:two-component system, OmpR family, sensor histidine kinase BaeS